MFSIACTSGATCIEVGRRRPRAADDRRRRHVDGRRHGARQQQAADPDRVPVELDLLRGRRPRQRDEVDRRRPDLGVAVRARTATRSTGSPARRTTVCYATDIYAHVIKTTDGGATWTWQTTPITTPGVARSPSTGGPNPFAGLMAISCSDANTCVGVGLYVDRRPARRSRAPDPPIVTTTDGGTTWTRQASEHRHGQLPARRLVPARHDDVLRGRPRRHDRHDDRPRRPGRPRRRTRRTC